MKWLLSWDAPCVWTFPDYAALSSIIRDLSVHQDINIRSMGVYHLWGNEVL